MIDTLEFEAGGRTYACRVDNTPGSRLASWWWFTVSGDAHRYAPFRAAESDTAVSVRTRVLAYYTDHQTRRANPAVGRSGWGRRPAVPPSTDAPDADGSANG